MVERTNEIAHLVEHQNINLRVAGSIPAFVTKCYRSAEVAAIQCEAIEKRTNDMKVRILPPPPIGRSSLTVKALEFGSSIVSP